MPNQSARESGRPLNRRIIVSALSGLLFPADVIAASDNQKRLIHKAASNLAATMARLHGGDWSAHVDHSTGFILIQPRPSRAPRE